MHDVLPPERLRKPMNGESQEPRVSAPKGRHRLSGWLSALMVLMMLAGALAIGTSRYLEQQRQVQATAHQQRDFVPTVRVATVQASDSISLVSLPATTLAFATANINARASGYIEKRYVDIGDRVKKGQLLAEITAPELDHQIAQAEHTLAQNKATVQQVQANLDLWRVTWGRDKPLVEKGWATQQQGTIDVQNVKAQEANLAVAQANVAAQQAQVNVLHQQKDYQSVVAPFDGVVTQRNVDVGTLVQADAVSGTFMFTVMQSNVIRTQAFVPQDEAFGIQPGVQAVVRVPEMPNRTFPGTVTRIADALQPGTRTLLTEIDVPNRDGALAVGIYCTVELHIPRKTPSLVVPSEALIFNGDGPQVAVVEDGVVHLRKVSIARDMGTSLELNAGVKAGDKVVLNPAVNLAEGNRVRASGGSSRAEAAK